MDLPKASRLFRETWFRLETSLCIRHSWLVRTKRFHNFPFEGRMLQQSKCLLDDESFQWETAERVAVAVACKSHVVRTGWGTAVAAAE